MNSKRRILTALSFNQPDRIPIDFGFTPVSGIHHKDLEVYKLAFETAMEIFELSKSFPKEERYSLTDQIRRSSRSVSANKVF